MTPDAQHLLAPGRSAVSEPSHGHPLLILASGFLLGIAVATFWFAASDFQPKSVPSDTPVSLAAGFSNNSFGDLLSVHNQAAGNHVNVDLVNIPTPGVWVVITEIRGGDLGNILGAARVLGPETNLSVDLQRETIPGQTYAVVLYREDGDGVFNYQADSVYVDWNTEKRVIALFNTTP